MAALSALNPIGIINGAVNSVGDAVRDLLGFGATKPTFNDPARNTIDMFQAEVLGNGLAEEDRFELYMSYPNCLQNSAYKFMDGTTTRAESMSFPPMHIYTKQRKIFGPGVPMPMGADYGGEQGLAISFLMDRDMQTKRMFDVWMRSIVDTDTQLVAYQADYVAQIGVRQLDRSNNCVYEAVILDVFPTDMQAMQLSMQANDGTFHRLTVTFKYRKWTIKDISAANANALSANETLVSQGGDTIKSVSNQMNSKFSSIEQSALSGVKIF